MNVIKRIGFSVIATVVILSVVEMYVYGLVTYINVLIGGEGVSLINRIITVTITVALLIIFYFAEISVKGGDDLDDYDEDAAKEFEA